MLGKGWCHLFKASLEAVVWIHISRILLLLAPTTGFSHDLHIRVRTSISSRGHIEGIVLCVGHMSCVNESRWEVRDFSALNLACGWCELVSQLLASKDPVKCSTEVNVVSL